MPIRPNLRSHFQILPDAVETFLAWWGQDEDKGEGNCSLLQLNVEERELFGFEPGQNDWFFTSDDDWRIGTVLRDELGMSGAVVIYLNGEFKAAVLWNGPLCKLDLNSALYFNDDLWNSLSEKFYHVLLNKSRFKVFLKAEVFLDHKWDELEGFWCWSRSPRWEGDVWALSVTPVCSSSPPGCVPAVELLGCILREVKDFCEHSEQSGADQSCSSEGSAQMLLHLHLLGTSFWTAWLSFEIDLGFHVLPSSLLLHSLFSWAHEIQSNNLFWIKTEYVMNCLCHWKWRICTRVRILF